MDISGLIIDCTEEHFDTVTASVEAMEEVEILHLQPPSRILALVEAADIDPSMDVSKRIWAIPGVAAINLTYHYHDVAEEHGELQYQTETTTNQDAMNDKEPGLRESAGSSGRQ